MSKIYAANPVLAFSVVWVITLILVGLRLTSNIEPLRVSTLFLVLLNLVSSLIIYFSVEKMFIRTGSYDQKENAINGSSKKFVKVTLVLWFVGTLIDIAYSQGVPIVWAIVGSAKDYTDFGIPTFHGIINAFFLFSVSAIFLFHLQTNEVRFRNIFIFLLFWPIIMLGRGIMISLVVQFLGIYLLYSKTKISGLVTSIRYVFIALVVILVFGYIGDLRGSQNPFSYLVTERSEKFFNALPSGFLWIYIYITTGINNVNYSIDTVQPGWTVYYSVLNLLPSVFRTSLDRYELNDSLFALIDSNLNTSSFYSGFISDFGIYGGFFGGVILQLIASIFYLFAKKLNKGYLISYSILYQCLILSVFYDLLFLLPYIFQIIVATLFATTYRNPKLLPYEANLLLKN
jgi:oligosaccharide repeat unit polymerase